ncbi:MAG TPA: hypothetical protein VM621_10390 [Luteibacter sp.]|nr:hypothetical protein [Luteibacter sp.]HVI55447.1 hypothetical protein [Luteibacter sp.]
MFRCKLAKMVNGAMVTVTYIGPYDRIPSGWSMFMRRIVGPSCGMAA